MPDVEIIPADRATWSRWRSVPAAAPDTLVHLAWEEDLPFHGLAGLVDFDAEGIYSRAVRSAGFTGAAHQWLLLGGRLSVGATRTAFVGLGAPEGAERNIDPVGLARRITALGGRRVALCPACPPERMRLATETLAALADTVAREGAGVHAAAWVFAVGPEDVARVRRAVAGPLRAAEDTPHEPV